jgi:membrane-associated phospholipid phosphatase
MPALPAFFIEHNNCIIQEASVIIIALDMFERLSSKFKKTLAALALLSLEMIVVITLFIAALSVFILVARKIFIHDRTEFDYRVFTYLEGFVSERNNQIMNFFTFLGKHDFLIPANLLLIAFFLFRKLKWYSIKIPAIALSSLALMFILKNLFNRPRPGIPLLYEASGLSFPSGHALMSVTFYGLLIYIIYKTVKTVAIKWTIISLLIFLIIIIGFSRIYLRVHYTTDVIAGFSVGFLWLVFAIYLLNRMERYSRRKLNKVVSEEPVGT